MKSSESSGGNDHQDQANKVDKLVYISVACFLVCSAFWLTAASRLEDFRSIVLRGLCVLLFCLVLERFVVFFGGDHLKSPYITLHFGLGLVQNISYVIFFLVNPTLFAKLWTSAYFGYYVWTWYVLILRPKEVFSLFRVFYAIHHTVSFFITGTWILVATSCNCEYEKYILRGIVLWLSADIWVYLVNFSRSVIPGMPIETVRRLQLLAFVLERLQRVTAYLQGFIVTQMHISALGWVVFGTGLFNDVLDASFQARSLAVFFMAKKEDDADETEKIENSDVEANPPIVFSSS